jgi:diguanylate cyclase (GGDEF)-like protein
MNKALPALRAALIEPDQTFDELPFSVVVTNASGNVTFANKPAKGLFAPLRPAGFGLRTLLGLSGSTGSADLIKAVESGAETSPIRIGWSNGRTFEARTWRTPGGGCNICLVEVTTYVNSAELAIVDALTGLATRPGLHMRLNSLLSEVREAKSSVAVLYIDLDRFKNVNDSLGHPVGDALLVQVADRLRTTARGSDIIARLGGDEFAIVQINVPQPQAAEALAARLVDLIGRTYIAAGHMLTIGASVGIALAPEHGNDVATILRHADLAMYRAKADGRGSFRFFQSSMHMEMQSRRLLETDLRKALAFKEFELFYQPQVILETSLLIGFEALLRWRSPARGLVSPAQFVPLAEEIGLISRIGEWVLHTACREAAAWPDPLFIAVNISAMQLRGDKLLPAVRAALAASGLDPRRLELEITEGSLLDHTDSTLTILQSLKALGVQISLDDFGTGYSSLSYLQKFPFDKIKIDQSFVRGAQHGNEADAIIRAVAGLGASLGMTTIAQGVETQEQLERVRASGCASIQGYLAGRPLTAADALTMMNRKPACETS